LIYRVSAVSECPEIVSIGVDKLILKFVWKGKGNNIA
jgi:hypothetical protein